MIKAKGKITLAVAKKVVSNLLKGNPGLKPDHGEHGQCSWFVERGNPYTGISPEKNINIEVEVPEQNVRQDDEILLDVLGSFKDHEKQLLYTNRRAYDLKLFNTIGEEIRRNKPYQCSNILIPQGEVSRQGAGYFLVVPPFAASLVRVTNVDELMKVVEERSPGFVETYKQREVEKNKDLSNTISVQIGPCENDNQINQIWAQVKDKGAPPDFKTEGPSNTSVTIKSGWGGQTKQVTRRVQTYNLVYANFRDARNAFKKLMNLATQVNKGTEATYLKVFGGGNWSEKQKSVFTTPGRGRAKF